MTDYAFLNQIPRAHVNDARQILMKDLGSAFAHLNNGGTIPAAQQAIITAGYNLIQPASAGGTLDVELRNAYQRVTAIW